MALTVTDLFTPLTQAQVLDQFLTLLEASGVPARSWRVGGVARSILSPVAFTVAGFTSVLSTAISGQFLPTATGNWLTTLAQYVYGVTRIPASFATGNLTLVNAGGGIFTQAAGTVQVINPATGKGYTNASAFTLGAASTLSVPFVANELGTASSASPDAITQLQTVLTGVTVTNPLAFVGSDAESDTALQTRCLNRLGTFSLAGPRSAYAYCAKSATRLDGSAVNINRVLVSPSSSTGVVTIYVASPSGAPISTDVTAIQALVESAARPDSVTATVIAATPVALTSTMTVWCKTTPGLDAPTVQALVATAVANLLSTWPIGGITKAPYPQGYLYGDRVAAAVLSAHPQIYDVDGVDTDIALSAGQVATMAATIAVNFTVVGDS